MVNTYIFNTVDAKFSFVLCILYRNLLLVYNLSS